MRINAVKVYVVHVNQSVYAMDCGYSAMLEEWGQNTDRITAEIISEHIYALPVGYECSEGEDGRLHVYNEKGSLCDIVCYTGRYVKIVDYDRPYDDDIRLKRINPSIAARVQERGK